MKLMTPEHLILTLHSVSPGTSANRRDRTSALQHRRPGRPLSFHRLLIAPQIQCCNGRQTLQLHVTSPEVLLLDHKLQAQHRRFQTFSTSDDDVRSANKAGVCRFSVDEPGQLGCWFGTMGGTVHPDFISGMVPWLSSRYFGTPFGKR